MPQINDPTVTLDQLQAAYNSTAYALNVADVTQAAQAAADTAYDKGVKAAIEAWERDNADLVTARNVAKAAHDAAKAKAAAKKEALKGLLALYWLENRSDEKPITGLAKRDSVIATIRSGQEALLHMQLREHAPWLLVIDEKRLTQFVRDNAVIQADGTAYLPSPMGSYFNALVPLVSREATVSDSTLIKNAPDTDPDALTPEQEDELEAAAIEEQDTAEEQRLAAAVANTTNDDFNDIGDIPF